MALSADKFYDVDAEMWPDLNKGRIVLMPVRVGVDRRTGKVLIGWKHVEQSILVILATRFHERVLRRWCGSFVPHLLGDSMIERVVTRFYWAIITSIDLWEPNYRIKQIVISQRDDKSPLNDVEQIRLGNIKTQTVGVYRPRAHLGDVTPEQRRSFGMTGLGTGVWER